MDLTCRCVPANQTSVSRLVAGCTSSVNSLTGRVTDLETEVTDLDSRVDALEGINESAFIIVDNEAELTAALLVGKHILLRGQGNAGVIEITSMKTVAIPGTKIWGYGYRYNNVNHRSKIKCRFTNPKPYGTPFQDIAFNIQTSNVEFAGFEVEGLDVNNLVDASYIPFYLSPAHAIKNIHICDIKAYNIQNFIAKWGYQNAQITRQLVVERCEIDNVVGYAFYLRESIYDSIIRDNNITLRQDGDPATFTNSQGFHVVSDIRRMRVENNRIKNPVRMGMEFFSVAYTVGNFMLMEDIQIVGNIINNAGSMGISATYGTYLIDGNIINTAYGIGIESANGSTLNENINIHTARITNNTIRNVTAINNYATGISVDKSINDHVSGNRIDVVSSTFVGANDFAYSRGIMLYGSRRAKICDNQIHNVNGCAILIQNAGYPITEAQSVVENNNILMRDADTKAKYAVLVQGCTSVIRNNVAWEPVSQVAQAKYLAQFLSPNGAVYPGLEWTAPVTTNAFFRESNLVITY